MTTTQRIEILLKLKNYIQLNTTEWQATKQNASLANPWFTPQFIELAIDNICHFFLDEEKINQWLNGYEVNENNNAAKTVGVVMAGNIPLVGFHDFLCVFLSGHKLLIKPSGKDEILIKQIVNKLYEWDEKTKSEIAFAQTLKNCDAYIATGSNNSSRYFDFYFGKYPYIIRRNRTSVAVLQGNETPDELNDLAKDIHLYFGQGCRNVTHLFVPENYDFKPLLNALQPYDYFLDFHKYKHNYDYQLTLLMMNSKFYMTSGSIILNENESIFAAISQVHYSYYKSTNDLQNKLDATAKNIQCIVGKKYTPFGKAQQPGLADYADGIDTMQFLYKLN